MRYAILSDVHGNLEALEAVLADVGRHRPDAFLCLGDTVGYGPNPNECASRIQELGGRAIAGNHDRAAVGALDIRAFTPLARAAIEWTIEVVTDETRRWITTLPDRLEDPDFLAVHGSPRDPIEEYILDLPTSLAIFSEHPFALCLVGHSHVPGAFVLEADGTLSIRALPVGERMRLASSDRYIVNVGSVGQPRDGDPRASYLILETEPRTVTLQRLSYPIATTQRKMAARKLPAQLSQRLALGR
ncbi:MAG TPA: metallophosphoesterase family protein [bacterium]|nr:metallophosphoesterase family protein [bacterium]